MHRCCSRLRDSRLHVLLRWQNAHARRTVICAESAREEIKEITDLVHPEIWKSRRGRDHRQRCLWSNRRTKNVRRCGYMPLAHLPEGEKKLACLMRDVNGSTYSMRSSHSLLSSSASVAVWGKRHSWLRAHQILCYPSQKRFTAHIPRPEAVEAAGGHQRRAPQIFE